MPPDEPSTPTSIAVAIGELKTQVSMGFQNVQTSIDKLTASSENQSGKIGDLETRSAVHDSQIDEIKKTMAEARPEKGRAWGIAGVVVAAVAVAYTVLNQLYGVAH